MLNQKMGPKGFQNTLSYNERVPCLLAGKHIKRNKISAKTSDMDLLRSNPSISTPSPISALPSISHFIQEGGGDLNKSVVLSKSPKKTERKE